MKLVSIVLALGAASTVIAAPISNSIAEKRTPMIYEEATAIGSWIGEKRSPENDKRMIYEEATAIGGWIGEKRSPEDKKRMIYEEATAIDGWVPDKN
jgi:hypothetical protein